MKQKQNVLLSIIIPVYNAESVLEDCLNSITPQLTDDMEVILVDDGSKDNSLRICQAFSEQYDNLKSFHKDNGGVSSARNKGIQKAKGEWITFVDSDDMVSDEYFNISDEKYDMIIKGYSSLSWDGIPMTNNEWIPLRDEAVDINSFLSKHISDISFRGPVQKFYKRNIIGNLRFHEEMKVGEDSCFVMEYLTKCKNMTISNKGHYIVRFHKSPAYVRYEATTEFATKQLNYIFEAFKRLNEVHPIPSMKLLEYVAFFKAISKEDWKRSPKRWFDKNKNIYQYIMPNLPTDAKLRLKVTKFLAQIGISK